MWTEQRTPGLPLRHAANSQCPTGSLRLRGKPVFARSGATLSELDPTAPAGCLRFADSRAHENARGRARHLCSASAVCRLTPRRCEARILAQSSREGRSQCWCQQEVRA